MTTGDSSIEGIARKLNDVATVHTVSAENAIHVAYGVITQGRSVFDSALADATGAGHEVWLDVVALYDMEAEALDALMEANFRIRKRISGYLAALGLPADGYSRESRDASQDLTYGLHEDLLD